MASNSLKNPGKILEFCGCGKVGTLNSFELDVVHHEEKQLLIVTSWNDKMIEAIDYKMGKIVWKISGEFEGKMTNPPSGGWRVMELL